LFSFQKIIKIRFISLPLQAYQELFFQLPGFTTSFHSRTPKLKKKISLGLKKEK